MWKKQRKIMTESLKPNIVKTFASIFLRETKQSCQSFKEDVPIDILQDMNELAMNVSCETLGGVNPQVLSGNRQAVLDILRYEELLQQRYFNPLLYPNLFWKFSSLKKEVDEIVQRYAEFGEKIFNENRRKAKQIQSENNEDQVSFNDCFLNYLINTNEFSHELTLRLAGIVIPIASETSGIVLSSVLLMLGMHSPVQDAIFEEFVAIFGNNDRDPTIEDLSRMDYLERVIKETMRLMPPGPLLLREVDQDVQLDSYVLPKGSKFLVLMEYVHRNPEFWPDPLKFDPDRFLPERSENRPRCAYVPFSVGSRNCPGGKYAMLFMKIALSTILRRYKVAEILDYKKVEDIEFIISVVGRAAKGYRIILKKRI